MTQTIALPAGQRNALAAYHVLATYDVLRSVRYGDMASSRRGRELNRLADALLAAGVRIDREGEFPTDELARDEVARAWDEQLAPRLRRVLRENFRHGTRYTQATIEAHEATAARLGVIGRYVATVSQHARQRAPLAS